jgi:L-ribulose-5-phosphate 3-epimerase
MNNRRDFIYNAMMSSIGISALSMVGCSSQRILEQTKKNRNGPLISLAQWSLNRAFFGGSLDPSNFPTIAKRDYDISAVEYVNQFYTKHALNDSFWINLNRQATDEGVKSLLIMVDNEGDLGNPNDSERHLVIENHTKWIHAAKLLGCHSIRVNAFGDGSKEVVREALIDGMGRLSDFAAKEGINVLIENHGLYSSDGKWLAGIIREADRPNFGTLPDFGNWCLSAKWGSTQNNKCEESYDIYQGVKDFLPFAHGVSAKSYEFNADGNETHIDYYKMMSIVKKFGFTGYIGVEYEGKVLSEPDGIRATKALIEKSWKSA